MKQRMSSNLLFSKAEPKEFVDRIEIKEKIIEICDSMLANPKTFFKVIDIYGIGGIGKSRLMTELKSELKNSPCISRFLYSL